MRSVASTFVAAMSCLTCSAGAQTQVQAANDGQAQLWQPDVVSTPLTEVRITFSPDGERMLWGAIGWSGGAGGWDIYESIRSGQGWSAPRAVAFNSSANDFDPAFAPDASGVYFFSNRPGGQGKDDIYFVPFDATSGRYGVARNMGPEVNSAGDDWAPTVAPDGQQLLFASDGRGGRGKHDLFIATRSGNDWGAAENLAAVNTPKDDFDAAFLHDGRSIVYTSGDMEGIVQLYLASFRDGRLQAPRRLPASVNSTEPGAWTFGPSISPHDPQGLYFTSQRVPGRGRADIYRLEYAGAADLYARSEDVDAAFDRAFAEHLRAVTARDLPALERTLTSSPELPLILPDGRRLATRREFLDFHREWFASSTWTMQFQPVARYVGADAAVASTRSRYTDVENGEPVWSESWVTFTFRREGGRWALVHDQNTRIRTGKGAP